jgi:hypothetical protein
MLLDLVKESSPIMLLSLVKTLLDSTIPSAKELSDLDIPNFAIYLEVFLSKLKYVLYIFSE